MKGWKSILATLAVALVATGASAPVYGAGVGVYFDQDATQQFAFFEGGLDRFHTAYVIAVDTEMWVGGVAFQLNLDERIGLWSVEYPEALKMGEPQSGVLIGFHHCRNGHYGEVVVAAILNLWTGTALMTNAEIKIVAHPEEGAVMVADCEGVLHPVDGYNAFLTITVDTDETSWGAVKNLYR
jgi:hypothetical protein